MWTKAALALAIAVLAVTVYRAATQSITIDEAIMYSRFVAPPVAAMFSHYDANNHVLYTLLAKMSVALFGVSEFTLRLPSILASIILFGTIHRLTRFAFGPGPWCFLGFALVATNPFLLDYFSAARGYGLALALLTVAMYEMLRFLSGRTSAGRLYSIALPLGLSVAANLSFLFPALALAGVFILLAVAGPHAVRIVALTDHFIVPAVIAPFLLLALPLARAERAAFYFGRDTLLESVQSLVQVGFWYGPAHFAPFNRPAYTQLLRDVYNSPALVFVVLTLAIALWIAPLLRRFVQQKFVEAPNDLFFLLLGSTTLLTLLGLVMARWIFALRYPLTRTGIYFVLLFTLLFCSLAYGASRRLPLRIAGYAAAVLVIAQYVSVFNTAYYVEWQFDAGAKRMANYLRTHQTNSEPLTIAAHWLFQPSLDFYRDRYHLNWAPLIEPSPETQAQVFVVPPDNLDLLQQHHLKLIYRDPVSQIALATGADAYSR